MHRNPLTLNELASLNEIPQPKKILYLITDLNTGGAQKLLVLLMRKIDITRYQPIIACLFGSRTLVGEEIREMNFRLVDLNMSKPWHLASLWRLYWLMRNERVSIVHSSLFHADLIARLVGRMALVPLIITWRHNISLGSWSRDFLYNHTINMTDHIIAVSEQIRQAELTGGRTSPEKVSMIHNGIDTNLYQRSSDHAREQIRAELNVPNRAFLIGSIGRLHPQKGFSILLEAFALIQHQIPLARLLIVGDGDLREDLFTLSISLGIKNRTVFTGNLIDIPNILQAMDVFILTSLWEGIPLAILEAMAAKLPVIATSVGGIPEIIRDGENGILVPSENPQAIAEAISRYYYDPDLRKKLALAGHQRVRNDFSIESLIKQMQNLYERLLSEKGI